MFYIIEFQKRGLLHAHILLFLDSSSQFPDPKNIDRIICAEIPYQFDHPKLYKVVKRFMIPSPCDADNMFSSCMKEGCCSKF